MEVTMGEILWLVLMLGLCWWAYSVLKEYL